MSLDTIRGEIEKVDYEILKLLARRMDLAEAIIEEKKTKGMAINDDRQNSLVIKRAMEKATELNIDTVAVREIFSRLIQMSIDRQHEMSGEGKLP